MAVLRGRKSADRRRVGRPRNGDTKACSNCGATLEFNERYRLEGHTVPSWVCDNASCRVREIVRADGMSGIAVSRQLLRDSVEVQARAKRTMLKARSRDENSRKRVAKSEVRLKRKPS